VVSSGDEKPYEDLGEDEERHEPGSCEEAECKGVTKEKVRKVVRSRRDVSGRGEGRKMS